MSRQSFDLVGRIERVGPEQSFPSGFRKREFVVCDLDPKYPQNIAFEATKGMVDKVGAFAQGDMVAVSFDINCREHNGRHFVSLRAWKIERAAKLGGESRAVTNAEAVQATAAPVPPPPQPTLFDANAERPAPVVPDDPGANLEDLPF